MTGPRSPREARILELDGLRGIAILMVLVCHYIFPDPGATSGSAARLFGFNIFGSGVDLFFVLSGFLIGGILLDHRSSDRYFKAFYARRTCRILPVYYGFLVVTAVAGVIEHIHGRLTPVFDAGTPFWMFPLFLQNFSLAWFGDWGWFTVTMAWSLALEEQAYLSLPAAVRIFGRRTLVRLAAAIMLGAAIARFLLPDQPHTYGALVLAAANADGIAAGFLCAVFVRSAFKLPARALAFAALASAGLVMATNLESSPVSFLRGSALAIFYSACLLLAERGSLSLLRSSLLRFFGTISYSLYLVHQSSLALFRTIARHIFHGHLLEEQVIVPVVAFLLSVVGCWLLWICLEKPLISWARTRFPY